MVNRFGAEPAGMEAAIGPAIGQCCFEVGPEVAREFGPWNSDAKTHLDLAGINRAQLEQAGISKIYEATLCTMCAKQFHSFRRDKENAGRMMSFVGSTAGK
jgi:polyphenol oxidase